jgi:DNA mismatch repair protein MutS
VSTKEIGQKVVFLRKLTPGGSNHSFGIHVARMAGMPQLLVERAQEILKELEEKHIDAPANPIHADAQKNQASAPQTPDLKKKVKNIASPLQLHIFDVDEFTLRIKEELLGLDLNTMTPMDALWKLNELKRIAEKK